MCQFKNDHLQILMSIPKSVLAKISNACKHYCIITRGGKVISTGYNQDAGFRYRGDDYRMHAECSALRKLPEKYLLKVASRGLAGHSF